MTGPLGDVPSTEQLMTIVRSERDGCVLLTVRGEVDLSTGERFRATASDALRHAPDRPLVLDLSGVEFLSSSGLGQLVALHDEAHGLDTALRVVVDPARPISRPITTMGLDEVLTMFRTVDDALAG